MLDNDDSMSRSEHTVEPDEDHQQVNQISDTSGKIHSWCSTLSSSCRNSETAKTSSRTRYTKWFTIQAAIGNNWREKNLTLRNAKDQQM